MGVGPQGSGWTKARAVACRSAQPCAHSTRQLAHRRHGLERPATGLPPHHDVGRGCTGLGSTSACCLRTRGARPPGPVLWGLAEAGVPVPECAARGQVAGHWSWWSKGFGMVAPTRISAAKPEEEEGRRSAHLPQWWHEGPARQLALPDGPPTVESLPLVCRAGRCCGPYSGSVRPRRSVAPRRRGEAPARRLKKRAILSHMHGVYVIVRTGGGGRIAFSTRRCGAFDMQVVRTCDSGL